MITSFEELIELAKSKGTKKIAVAVAEDKEVLEAVKLASEFKLVYPTLVGDVDKIKKLGEEIDFNFNQAKIVDEKDQVLAAREATRLVSSGECDILMKGLVPTATIMKQVLDKEIGLRTEKVISHVAVFHVKTYHKVFLVTDPAMNITPDLQQKKQIIENTVELAHSLDIETPKVAILAASEKVSPKMEATVHAEELVNMYKNGEIKDCVVDGPFALDNAISKEAAKVKGIVSDVAGNPDILLVPNIDAGNVLYKSLTFLAGAKSAGIILGTKAPIVLTSRADNKEAKLHSIALGVLLASK
ncbi:MAG: phosphate butyryltransferase [Tissierellia bacterium]|nr:phosphate butyryltransferase [Tissierellia bacterium]